MNKNHIDNELKERHLSINHKDITIFIFNVFFPSFVLFCGKVLNDDFICAKVRIHVICLSIIDKKKTFFLDIFSIAFGFLIHDLITN